MARLPGLQVVRSKIHVADVEGVLWRAGEDRDDTYSLFVEPGVFFDMVDQTRWINHSCEPNIEVLVELTRGGNAWAQFQALRDLEAGEELFYDYGFPQELKERCYCGAESCRGWIVEKSPVQLVRTTG